MTRMPPRNVCIFGNERSWTRPQVKEFNISHSTVDGLEPELLEPDKLEPKEDAELHETDLARPAIIYPVERWDIRR